MELERLSVRLRPRRGWEALDLGFQMARAWWRPIWGVWLMVYLPIAVALHGAFHDRLWMAAVALWWLKPLFDRFVLHVVSRAVFGAPPAIGDTLAAWRDLLRPGAVAALTVARLHPARSLLLPVWQLERQTGKVARARRTALARRMRGYAVWLTLVCLSFELVVVFLSLDLAGELFKPAGADIGFDLRALFRSDQGEWQWDWFDSIGYIVAVSIVEPFYVAAGFALYLNRRAILEGWDIELQLRQLGGRLGSARAGLAVALVFVFAAMLASPEATAEEPAAKETVRAVLEAPEFQQYRETMRWQYRGARTRADAPQSDFWRGIGRALAGLSQAALWVTVGIGAIILVLVARRALPRFRGADADAYQPPDTLFGLEVAPESLPDDVAAAALALVRAGRTREALSLLYRGALSVLVHRDQVALAEGHTEADCLRASRDALAPLSAAYFARLVDVWIAAAYAGRLPDPTQAEALAHDWPPHFAPPRPTPSEPLTPSVPS